MLIKPPARRCAEAAQEGSVSGAAARLGITQPAMSRTLARLRATTGDAVLVRNGRAMVPSQRANTVRAEVREIVRDARVLLSPAKPLDPAELERMRSPKAVLDAEGRYEAAGFLTPRAT